MPRPAVMGGMGTMGMGGFGGMGMELARPTSLNMELFGGNTALAAPAFTMASSAPAFTAPSSSPMFGATSAATATSTSAAVEAEAEATTTDEAEEIFESSEERNEKHGKGDGKWLPVFLLSVWFCFCIVVFHVCPSTQQTNNQKKKVSK